MTALSDYLTDNKGDRTIDSIKAKAEAAGHGIDRATVSKYIAGKGAKNPPDSVLKALAAGMGLDVRHLRTLAGFPPGELETYKPPDYADRLNRDQRSALDELIRTIVERGVEGAEHPAANTGAASRGARERPPRSGGPENAEEREFRKDLEDDRKQDAEEGPGQLA